MLAAAVKICVFLIALSASVVSAQQTTTLRVNVLDQNSNSIPNFAARLKSGDKIIKEIKAENSAGNVFSNIEAGKYVLEIKAAGFKSLSREIEMKAGENELTVTLEVGEVVEKVNVEQDAQAKAIDDGFSNFLTRQQIANLPDDPDELEAELKRIAGGDNVVIRVDGFAGGRLPAKSQIASIRIVRSSYDAENHQLGTTFVDIVTRVGNSRFSGAISFNFNDEAFNARNTFSRLRFPEQTRDTLFFLDGPLIKNKTSFSVTILDNRDFAARNVIAVLPSGAINQYVAGSSASTYLDASLTHNLTKNLPVKLRYSFSNGNFKNLGVGNFNLPERAFSVKNRSHDLRFSESGYVGKRF